ncbi:Glutamyl-tRNA(Gln) amidotransferase subunit D [uncultured archaeon]|nr:Glutamyl-tRNA(Gln) amidotransferase subunit D [uncultured archaeon]
MYSSSVEKLLKDAGVQIGDPLRVEREGQVFEGLLMPRPDIGDADCLVLKLKSGYNIGVEGKGVKIGKLSSSRDEFLGSLPREGKAKKADEEGAKPNNAPLMLISTGGTIASKVDYVTGAVYPQLGADELMASIPRLNRVGPLKTRTLLSILSEDMRPEHWTQIAKGVAEAFADGAPGVVLPHGTDTMGYTAAALSFALHDLPGPVVLTGSQRSPDRGSSDAPANLFASAAAARADWAGVAICMHADSSDGTNLLHWGTRVIKSHTSMRGAFRSIGLPPIGRVDCDTGHVEIADAEVPKRDSKRRLTLKDKFSSNVHFAWIYPGITPKTVEKWADYDGVLISGTGLGNAPVWASEPGNPHSILPALRQLHQSGVVVAMASQTVGGRVNMDVYAGGRLLRSAGVLGQRADWLAETAYVKLCWALGQEKDPKKAAGLLETPLCRDILPRSRVEDALPWLLSES